ncbi:hypothetical protein [Novosphingobium sp. P6W]|jgi:hypothetical protein|uniref:hypothetical protein n=1 Tax=Novosphingobium sp. P6W TaxID=1609758 RepID=UPI0005C2BD3B|nr:hypothetical protein [Novosphingobium sp. P6W]AXB75649.1 hypothetical protein TQ38_003235 [Novosphingobium sp. P6W]KIS33124.1 hypothetical protein TQ38_06645 [Novosphingobium sp. P6W]
MQISAAHCREQEALQRAKALSEPLENRRKIALDAAKAWEAEAVWAENRASKSTPLDKLDVAIALEFEREAKSGLSE